MQRTQISLEDADRRLLDEEASRTGRSISSLIRQAVRAEFGANGQDGESFRAVLEDSAGAWADRDFDGEEYVERMRTGARWEQIGL